MDEAEISYYRNICKIMLSTRSARFIASRSLSVQDRFSTFTLAILSVFLVGVSIYSFVFSDSINSKISRYINIFTVVNSVGILIVTLYDFAMSRALLAFRIHENALKITTIMRSLERELERSEKNDDEIRRLAAEYEDLNKETFLNHTPRDFRISQITAWKGFCCATFAALVVGGAYKAYDFFVSVFLDIFVLALSLVVLYFILTS